MTIVTPARGGRAARARWDPRWDVAVLAVVFAAGSVGCNSPVWFLDGGFPERLAKEENKAILFYFKAWDSSQHRDFKLQVLEAADVKAELLDTINIELEFAWFPEYARRYRVQTPQACVMCTPDGRLVHTTLFVNPVPSKEAFLDWLRRAKEIAAPPPTSAPAP